jgi:hypothetical protein
MGNVLFLIAFLALPIAAFFVHRSLTWVVGAVGAAIALAGALVAFSLELGYRWNFTSLQLLTTAALALVLVGAFVTRRISGSPTPSITFNRQFVSVIAPSLALFLFIAISRLAAAKQAGMFTGVGFLVSRITAEDNAKWLDFTGQLVTGNEIVQTVPMGGPLQLFVVIVATFLAVVSTLAMGGVNQVFVASNSVIYAEFILVALTPFALAAVAEYRMRAGKSGERRFIPAPLIWAGALVLAVGSLSVSGLGHLTFQFVMLVVAFWVGVFLIGTKVKHAYLYSSLAVVAVSIVWFPLTPISVVVIIGGLIAIASRIISSRRFGASDLLALVLWLAMIVFTWSSFMSTIGFITDGAVTASAGGGGGGGGIRAAVTAMLPSLDLLVSQGGTQTVAPILALLAALVSVLGAMFIIRSRPNARRSRLLFAFGPAILITGFAIALSTLGTWWAGSGPAYGALKSTFLATIVLIAVMAPLALVQIDAKRTGVTLVRVTGIAVIIYLLTVDSLLPRALTYASPKQWPDVAGPGRGYWWPAEVRTEAKQDIADSPIGCAFYPTGARVPTALPEGQVTYACTRILTGLAGADSTGLPIVNWLRREWFTNTPAWLEEYPGLITVPQDLRERKLILMNEVKEVIGLETLQTFMDREKPEWAKDGASAPTG